MRQYVNSDAFSFLSKIFYPFAKPWMLIDNALHKVNGFFFVLSHMLSLMHEQDLIHFRKVLNIDKMSYILNKSY